MAGKIQVNSCLTFHHAILPPIPSTPYFPQLKFQMRVGRMVVKVGRESAIMGVCVCVCDQTYSPTCCLFASKPLSPALR